MKAIKLGLAIGLSLLSAVSFANNRVNREECKTIYYGETQNNETVLLCFKNDKVLFERSRVGSSSSTTFMEKNKGGVFSTRFSATEHGIYLRDSKDLKYWYGLEIKDGAGTFYRLVDKKFVPKDHVPELEVDKTYPLKSEHFVFDEELVKELPHSHNDAEE